MYLKHIRKPKKRGVHKTYQTISFQDYDDGYYRKGLPKFGDRFIDNGDGTITDKVSKLMWVKDPSQISGGLWGTLGVPATMTWADAIANCEALDYAGYQDWRMPNITELESIVDYGRYFPAINTVYFPNTSINYYWSSSTVVYLTTYAWIVYSYNGYTYYTGKTNLRYVRPVRKG